jgi:hypothetical protein
MVLQSSESIFSSLPGYFGSCSVAFGLSGGEIQSRCTELFRKILSCCTKHADKAISSPATWFSTRESLFHQKRYGRQWQRAISETSFCGKCDDKFLRNVRISLTP